MPGASARPFPAKLGVPVHPFPGLRPFEYEESNLFFGRDGQVERMITKLSPTHFLAVVGTSGSGKSSLVRAGLLPALRSGMLAGAGSNWRIAIMRPGGDPIGKLARALNDKRVFGPAEPNFTDLQIAITEAVLRRGSRGLLETVRRNVGPNDPTKNLLVVVDQFEELFRFAREARRANDEQFENDAAAFVKLLLEAVKPDERGNRADIYIVLTMRSDFLGDCAQFWDLPEAINESQYLIPRLTRDQLREVIEGPIRLCRGQITTKLVNHLLNEVGDKQDQLPILQHALMRTWDKWKAARRAPSDPIDLTHYQAVGGMAEALSWHAEEAYAELPDERSQKVAEKLFKALTEMGVGKRETRRPCKLATLCAVIGAADNLAEPASEAEVSAVIEIFRRPGRSFLMPPVGEQKELTGKSEIDISHESLIRNWKRLWDWVNEEAEFVQLYSDLARAGKENWSVWDDPQLQTALNQYELNRPNQAWAQLYQLSYADARGFLERSQAARAAKAAEAERQLQKEEERKRLERERKRLKRWMIFIGLLGAIFLLLMVFAAQQARLAKFERNRADELRTRAEKSDRTTSRIIPLISESLLKSSEEQEFDQRLAKFKDLRQFYSDSGNKLGEGVMLVNIGELYFRKRKFTEAISSYKEALDELKKALPMERGEKLPKHLYVAHTLNKLGRAKMESSGGKEGKEEFQQSNEMLVEVSGPASLEFAASQKGLASFYQAQGKYDEAEPLLKSALQVDELILGSNHQQVAVDKNDLASLYLMAGEYAKAEPLYAQAKKTLEEVLARAPRPDEVKQRDSIYLYNTLASVYANSGANYTQLKKFEQAEPLLKQALDLHGQLLDPSHPTLAADYYNWGDYYLRQDRFVEADVNFKQAAEIFEQTLWKIHPNVLYAKRGLAKSYCKQRLYQQAENLFQELLDAPLPDGPAKEVFVARTKSNLAVCYLAQNKYGAAEPLFKAAQQVQERGQNKAELAETLKQYAELLQKTGRAAEAPPLLERVKSLEAGQTR